VTSSQVAAPGSRIRHANSGREFQQVDLTTTGSATTDGVGLASAKSLANGKLLDGG